jgi:hypothetical protein
MSRSSRARGSPRRCSPAASWARWPWARTATARPRTTAGTCSCRALADRRLLLFKAGGAVTLKARELLTEVPVADVDDIEIGKGVVTKPVTLTIRGETFAVETPRASNTDKLVQAFAAAKA